jgi:hypothetical protein
LDWIKVSDSGGQLSNAFSGGINNLEFQFVDIDGDDDLDIIFLDSDKTFGWYENTGTATNAEYVLSFEQIPGLFLSDWFYFVDIDSDNDMDIFEGNVDLISFRENIGNATSPLFELAMDTVYSDEGQPIFSEFGSNAVLADIDGDGDFDFFTGNSAGTVNYYENIGSQENFLLKFITNEWQNISIIGGRPSGILHGASSLEFVDIDNDNDLDLFWGDFFSNSLYFLENIGNTNKPEMQLVSNVYPVNADSVNSSGFNMPRFGDIDGDADFDMFVSVLFDPTVPQSLIFYSNTGNPQLPDFQKITNNYLKTLDVRSNSHPAFIDIDNDGDNDLIMGSQNNPFGSLHFLKNIGSISEPEFKYLDSAYFNITGDLSLTLNFGDLDGDNDYDLLVGLFDGKIDYYKNIGTPEVPDFFYQGKLTDNLGLEIDIGTTSTPFLYDLNSDGDLDLSIGGFNGKIKYYENTGSRFSYQFKLNETFFNAIDVGDNSSPFLFDYDDNGITDLFSGSRIGEFFYFRNNGTNENPVWQEMTNSFITGNFGNLTVPYFIDIDSDTDMDFFLGNVKGGLYLYENTSVTNVVHGKLELPADIRLTAHPNPFNPNVSIIIYLDSQRSLDISVFNILGEKVKSLYNGELNPGKHSLMWNGNDDDNALLPSGNYIVTFQCGVDIKSLKLTLIK